MRISDWSSDVCSSDLRVTLEITDAARAQSLPLNQEALIIALRNLVENAALHGPEHGVVTVDAEQEGFAIKDRGGGIAPEDAAKMQIGRASGRERVCQYVLIPVVAVSLINKKKNT